MAEKRKDAKGRNLKDGESQMPDGRYRFRYTDSSGVRQSVYSWRLVPTDKTPAGKRDGLCLREKEKQIEADARDGIDGRKAGQVTFNDMYYLYMDWKHDLKPSTRALYGEVFRSYIKDGIGLKKLADIRHSDVKRLYDSLMEKGLALSTVERVNTVIHPVFELAVRDDIIRKNPSDGALREIKDRDGKKGKRHALTIGEQEAFINYIASSNVYRHWLPLFTILLGTGCRIGEIAGLRWQDCDFKENTISINHILVYKNFDGEGYAFHILTPKTAAGSRTVPMLAEVRKALIKERTAQMEKGFPDFEVDGYRGFIFSTGEGNPIYPSNVDKAIKRICKAYNREEESRAENENRAPLAIRHFSAHNLRHTFCTRFCENETNIKVIQEIMGHSDISTTMNIYAEATENKKKESFANLEGKIKIS